MAPYSVQLDNGAFNIFNATKKLQTPQTLLYHAANLGAGQHVLNITNHPLQAGQGLSIDFAVTSTVPSVAEYVVSVLWWAGSMILIAYICSVSPKDRST
jgi:hypothetical protein